MKQCNVPLFKQLGISLLEVLLSLSIITIILIMATRYFFAATNNNKLNIAISQVGGLVTAAHNWKGVKTSFYGLTLQVLYDTGKLESFPGLDDSKASQIAVDDLWGDPFIIKHTAQNRAYIKVRLPSSGNCQALANAYAGAICDGASFTYTFS